MASVTDLGVLIIFLLQIQASCVDGEEVQASCVDEEEIQASCVAVHSMLKISIM